MNVRSAVRGGAAVCAAALLSAAAAAAQEPADATPANWHVAAHLEPFMTAPEPPARPAACVIDTGVTLTPDLQESVVARYAYDGGTLDDVWPARDGNPAGHGTHVATFIAGAVNGWGAAGAWPHARVVSVRVFPANGGAPEVYDYVDAIDRCRTSGYDVRVITIARTGLQGTDAEWSELENRIQDARAANVNVIAAAGNDGAAVAAPARLDGVFAVGAGTSAGDLCSFSARGNGLDLIAPGCDLALAGLDGQPLKLAGTSFAAPQVAAVLLALRAYTGMTAAAAESRLLETAKPTAAGPLLDAHAAAAASGLAWAEPPPASQQEPQPPPPASAGAPAPRPPASVVSAPRVRLPRPRARARIGPGKMRLLVTVANRPRGAQVELRFGRRIVVTRRSRIIVDTARPPRTLRVRFVFGDIRTPWVSVTARKRHAPGLRSR